MGILGKSGRAFEKREHLRLDFKGRKARKTFLSMVS